MPSTIAADCSVDVSSALTSWVTTVPDNSVISFPANACYRIDGTVEVDGRNGLDFEGNGATFKAMTLGGSHRTHWNFAGGSQITVRNMTVVGSDSAGGTPSAFDANLEWQHGIDLLGVTGATVSGVTIDNVYGDCIYVGLGANNTWSSNVSVHDDTCQRNGRQGMSVTAARGVTFDHNTFRQVALIGIDIEPNGGVTGAQGVKVTNNAFGTSAQPFVNVLGFSGGGAVSNISITGNTVRGRPLDANVLPASGQRWQDISFSNNTSDTVSKAYPNVVTVADTDGLTVTGNSQPGDSVNQVFAGVTASCNIVIGGNQFPGGGRQFSVAPYGCGGVRSGNCTTYASSATGSHQVCGAIRDKYEALGGPSGLLGYPTTDETGTPDGVGRFNHFADNASIYWTSTTGAWSIRGAIRSKWASLGWERGFLGYPVTDETGASDGVGRFNHFSRSGSMYWAPSTGAWSIHGAIRAKYLALSGPAGLLGYPTTDETTTPDGVGRFNHFNRSGSIYWAPSTGAWSIHGAIRAKWASMGWERGVLGYPVTDESGASDGAGRFNHFDRNGSIYWTQPMGPWSIHGDIRAKWASMGWERSCLGYPMSDELGMPGGRKSDLQRGVITFSWSTDRSTSSC